MVAYLWGMRLAIFAKELERVVPDHNIGFGRITFEDDRWQPEFLDYKPKSIYDTKSPLSAIREKEMEKYKSILTRIKQSDESGQKNNTSAFEDIEAKLNGIFNSAVYRYSRSPELRRLYPEMLENENLRVRFGIPTVKE